MLNNIGGKHFNLNFWPPANFWSGSATWKTTSILYSFTHNSRGHKLEYEVEKNSNTILNLVCTVIQYKLWSFDAGPQYTQEQSLAYDLNYSVSDLLVLHANLSHHPLTRKHTHTHTYTHTHTQNHTDKLARTRPHTQRDARDQSLIIYTEWESLLITSTEVTRDSQGNETIKDWAIAEQSKKSDVLDVD